MGTAINTTRTVLPMMFWAWKAKMKTNVRSKTAIVTGANRGNSTSLTHR